MKNFGRFVRWRMRGWFWGLCLIFLGWMFSLSNALASAVGSGDAQPDDAVAPPGGEPGVGERERILAVVKGAAARTLERIAALRAQVAQTRSSTLEGVESLRNVIPAEQARRTEAAKSNLEATAKRLAQTVEALDADLDAALDLARRLAQPDMSPKVAKLEMLPAERIDYLYPMYGAVVPEYGAIVPPPEKPPREVWQIVDPPPLSPFERLARATQEEFAGLDNALGETEKDLKASERAFAEAVGSVRQGLERQRNRTEIALGALEKALADLDADLRADLEAIREKTAKLAVILNELAEEKE